MSVTHEAFGKSRDGRDLFLYTIENGNGMKAKVTNLGAILVQLWVKDKEEIAVVWQTFPACS